MKCDWCKENIQFNPNEEFVPINIIMINTLSFKGVIPNPQRSRMGM